MLSVKVLLYLAAALTVCQSLPTELETAEDPTRIFEDYIKYTLYTYDKIYEEFTGQPVKPSDIGTVSELNNDIRVTVLVHGKQDGDSRTRFFTALRQAFFQQRPDTVIIEVDWYTISTLNLGDEFFVDVIGNDLAALVANGNINLQLLHFVGFDLGAHIVGYASKTLGRIRKITALSPVGTITRNSPYCLSAADAVFVEAIHSDVVGTRAIGTADPVGTVDIYLNTGTNQPNCRSDNTCNHQRAVDVFVATVEYNGHLSASGCSAFTDVTRNRCTLLPTIRVGSESIADKVGSGLYRATTGTVYPYSP